MSAPVTPLDVQKAHRPTGAPKLKDRGEPPEPQEPKEPPEAGLPHAKRHSAARQTIRPGAQPAAKVMRQTAAVPRGVHHPASETAHTPKGASPMTTQIAKHVAPLALDTWLRKAEEEEDQEGAEGEQDADDAKEEKTEKRIAEETGETEDGGDDDAESDQEPGDNPFDKSCTMEKCEGCGKKGCAGKMSKCATCASKGDMAKCATCTFVPPGKLHKAESGGEGAGHKYIKREGSPGHYTYTYPLEKDYKLHVSGGKDEAENEKTAAALHQGIKNAADLCQTDPPVCKDNFGIPREQMPQVPDDVADKFLADLAAKGVKTEKTEVKPGQLKATQKEINSEKVNGMAQAFKDGKLDLHNKAIIVSSDNYVLDGHHRWGALLLADPGHTMPVMKVDLPMKELLPASLKFPGVKSGQGFSAPSDGVDKKAEGKAKEEIKDAEGGAKGPGAPAGGEPKGAQGSAAPAEKGPPAGAAAPKAQAEATPQAEGGKPAEKAMPPGKEAQPGAPAAGKAIGQVNGKDVKAVPAKNAKWSEMSDHKSSARKELGKAAQAAHPDFDAGDHKAAHDMHAAKNAKAQAAMHAAVDDGDHAEAFKQNEKAKFHTQQMLAHDSAHRDMTAHGADESKGSEHSKELAGRFQKFRNERSTGGDNQVAKGGRDMSGLLGWMQKSGIPYTEGAENPPDATKGDATLSSKRSGSGQQDGIPYTGGAGAEGANPDELEETSMPSMVPGEGAQVNGANLGAGAKGGAGALSAVSQSGKAAGAGGVHDRQGPGKATTMADAAGGDESGSTSVLGDSPNDPKSVGDGVGDKEPKELDKTNAWEGAGEGRERMDTEHNTPPEFREKSSLTKSVGVMPGPAERADTHKREAAIRNLRKALADRLHVPLAEAPEAPAIPAGDAVMVKAMNGAIYTTSTDEMVDRVMKGGDGYYANGSTPVIAKSNALTRGTQCGQCNTVVPEMFKSGVCPNCAHDMAKGLPVAPLSMAGGLRPVRNQDIYIPHGTKK